MAQSLQVKKVGWWHERLADWMLANPDKTLGDAAKEFGCTRAHLSIIKNSDCFKIFWELKSAEYSGEVINKSTTSLVGVQEKAAGAAEQALDEINRRLDLAPEAMPFEQLMSVSKMGLGALGYGAKASSPTSVNVSIQTGLVTASDLQAARERVFKSHGIKAAEPAPQAEAKPPIEGTFEVVEE